MAKKLKDLVIRQVALVDRGANQEAKVALRKAADAEDQKDQGDDEEAEGETPKDEKAKKSVDVAADTKAMRKQLTELTNALADAQSEISVLKGVTSEGAGHVEPFRARYEKVNKELEEQREKLRKQLEVASKELEESKAEILKITKQRRHETFIKMAQEMSDLPGANADDFAGILDKIENTLTEKEFAKMHAMLTSWNTIVGKSVLFEEIAREPGAGALTGAEAQLNALAKEKQVADPKLTFAKAYAQVLAENPKIYKAYLAERRTKE